MPKSQLISVSKMDPWPLYDELFTGIDQCRREHPLVDNVPVWLAGAKPDRKQQPHLQTENIKNKKHSRPERKPCAMSDLY